MQQVVNDSRLRPCRTDSNHAILLEARSAYPLDRAFENGHGSFGRLARMGRSNGATAVIGAVRPFGLFSRLVTLPAGLENFGRARHHQQGTFLVEHWPARTPALTTFGIFHRTPAPATAISHRFSAQGLVCSSCRFSLQTCLKKI